MLIANFDRPFSGVLKLEPAAMLRTAADIDADFEETYNSKPPCTADGHPIESQIHSDV